MDAEVGRKGEDAERGEQVVVHASVSILVEHDGEIQATGVPFARALWSAETTEFCGKGRTDGRSCSRFTSNTTERVFSESGGSMDKRYQHRFEGGEWSTETMGSWAGRKVGRDRPEMFSDLCAGNDHSFRGRGEDAIPGVGLVGRGSSKDSLKMIWVPHFSFCMAF